MVSVTYRDADMSCVSQIEYGLTSVGRSHRLYSSLYCKLLCELFLSIFLLTPISKYSVNPSGLGLMVIFHIPRSMVLLKGGTAEDHLKSQSRVTEC